MKEPVTNIQIVNGKIICQLSPTEDFKKRVAINLATLNIYIYWKDHATRKIRYSLLLLLIR
jgi:hypothetical protein